MSAAYFNQYLENQVNNASPEELLVMLYNGAIRFVTEAEQAMADRRVGLQGVLIGKVINIINEVSVTLVQEIGGEIYTDLEVLYDFMNRELLQANINDDQERLKQVKGLLVGLRDTWLKAIEQLSGEQADKGVKGGAENLAENTLSPVSAAAY